MYVCMYVCALTTESSTATCTSVTMTRATCMHVCMYVCMYICAYMHIYVYGAEIIENGELDRDLYKCHNDPCHKIKSPGEAVEESQNMGIAILAFGAIILAIGGCLVMTVIQGGGCTSSVCVCIYINMYACMYVCMYIHKQTTVVVNQTVSPKRMGDTADGLHSRCHALLRLCLPALACCCLLSIRHSTALL